MLQNVAGSLEHYMTLLSTRQRLVASNIANADTPGYHTMDIDFRGELASTLDSKPNTVEVPGLTARNDGNNVSLDRESRLLAENALKFNVSANLVRSQLKAVRTAIEEKA